MPWLERHLWKSEFDLSAMRRVIGSRWLSSVLDTQTLDVLGTSGFHAASKKAGEVFAIEVELRRFVRTESILR